MANKKKQPVSESPSVPADDSTKIWKDPRFAHLINDPRFKRLPESKKKVTIDKRFESMFTDDKFRITHTVDKYGRRVTKASEQHLKKFYDLKSDEDAETDEEGEAAERAEEERQMAELPAEKASETDSSSEESEANDELELKPGELPRRIKKRLHDDDIDYARGEGKILTDSSSEEEDESDEDDELFIEHVWGELDRDAPRTEESTKRLAACNMDWDRMRAVDVMVLCNSFLPQGGGVLSVTIYPSEYGKQRLAEEEISGPQELVAPKLNESLTNEEGRTTHEDEDEEQGSQYHMEKLRQYQLNRLKYFYAVIECDCVATADQLYAECDGIEYESTANRLDLRFIPDDMEFDDEPKDSCVEMPDADRYKPRVFTTSALQQAKVHLTWDENSVDRREISDKLMSGNLDAVADHELRQYVGYSSESEDNEEETTRNENDSNNDDSHDSEEDNKDDSISKYKNLLNDIIQKEDEQAKNRVEKELTWGIAIPTSAAKSDVTVRKGLTPFETLLEKKKLKKKVKKTERKNAKGGGDQNSDSDDIDMNDPYFAEEFASDEFAKPLSKRAERKAARKKQAKTDSDDEAIHELGLLVDDENADGGRAHFSLKKIQERENESKSKARKRKQTLYKSKSTVAATKANTEEDNFNVNVNDSRFGAIYTNHHFNIDPTDSHFKKTRAMDTIIGEKLRRRDREEDNRDVPTVSGGDVAAPVDAKRPKKDVAVGMLVKSIKRKIAK